MDTDHISHGIEIAAPVERVWDALTDPGQLSNWFGSGGEFRRRDDGFLELRWGRGGFRARIEREDPPHRFSWRWALTVDEDPAPGNSTLVEFRLSESDGHTRLEVTESGFVGLRITDGEKTAAVNDNLAGWVGGFLGLKQYLEGYEESAPPWDVEERR